MKWVLKFGQSSKNYTKQDVKIELQLLKQKISKSCKTSKCEKRAFLIKCCNVAKCSMLLYCQVFNAAMLPIV